MEVHLDQTDLNSNSQDVNCSQTTFEHFTLEAQAAIVVAGRATYYTAKGTRNESYNAIYPPEGLRTEMMPGVLAHLR